MQTDILEYLPDFLKDVKEIVIHAKAVQPELADLWAAAENAYSDQFLYTMTENGIKRWEKMLKISPMGTDSLEDRRFRIINRVNAQLPYSYRMIEAHLTQMCGADGYTMAYDKDTWTLSIKIALTSKKQFAEIQSMVSEMIPTNIILSVDLLYNTHEILGRFTHEQLAQFTYEQLRNEILN